MPKKVKPSKTERKRKNARRRQGVADGIKEQMDDYLDSAEEEDFSDDEYDSEEEDFEEEEGMEEPPPIQQPRQDPPVEGPPPIQQPRQDPPVEGPPPVQQPRQDPPVEGPPPAQQPRQDPPVEGPPPVQQPRRDPPVEGPPPAQQPRQDPPVDEHHEEEQLSPLDQAKREISQMNSDRKDILKDVLVTRYDHFKEAGIFQEDDDDGVGEGENEGIEDVEDVEQPALLHGNNDRLPPPVRDDGHAVEDIPEDQNDHVYDDDDEEPRYHRSPIGGGGEPLPDLEPFTPHAPKSGGKGKKIFTEGLGIINDLIGLTSIGSAYTGSKEALETDPEKLKKLKEDQKGIKTAHGYANLASGGITTLLSGMGIYGSYQGTKSANLRKSNQAKFGVFKNLMGLGAGLSKMTGAGIGLWGDMTTNSAKTSAGIASAFGSGFGLLSNATSWISSVMDNKERGQIKDEVEALALGNHNDQDNATEELYRRRKNRIADKNSDAYRAAKRQHRALKARKYALQDAMGFQDIKRSQMTKGVIGSITSGLSLLSNVSQFIPGVANSVVGGIIKAVTPMFSTLGGYLEKYSGKISDARADRKTQTHRITIINKYLARKHQRIREQAAKAFADRADADTLSDLTEDETKRIALGRLGVQVDVTPQKVDETDLDAGFEYYNQKQARNIMSAPNAERRSMLSALHLDPDRATIDDLESALKGD